MPLCDTQVRITFAGNVAPSCSKDCITKNMWGAGGSNERVKEYSFGKIDFPQNQGKVRPRTAHCHTARYTLFPILAEEQGASCRRKP